MPITPCPVCKTNEFIIRDTPHVVRSFEEIKNAEKNGRSIET